MFKFILVILMVILLSLMAMVLFFPEKIMALARRSLRRRGGLVQKSITVEGRVWPYLEGGNFSKPVLILIHGFSGEKDNWAMLAPELKQDFHIIIPDLPGFGENERRSDLGFDNDSQTRRFHAFTKAMGLKRPHLAGNSMGGWIALRYAMDYPDELASLILLDSAGVLGADESELQRLAADEVYNPLTLSDISDSDRFLSFVMHKPPRIPARLKPAFHADALAHRDQLNDIFWVIAREMRDGALNDRLHQVRAPTLIIWGRQDRVIDVSSVAALQAGIPHAQAVIFDDIGHLPMIEAPKDTAAAIKDFIRRS
jgi:abhydrolase domain-containing protein 6